MYIYIYVHVYWQYMKYENQVGLLPALRRSINWFNMFQQIRCCRRTWPIWAESCRAQKTSVLPCFLQIGFWLSLTVRLCWIRGQYFFVSWPRLLSIANWGTDCVVRVLLQKQVDLAGDIPIYRKNKCRSSFGIFILKILKINVGVCWKSKNNFSTKIQRLPEPQTASKVPSSGSSTGKSTWSSARVLQRPLIVSVCVCVRVHISVRIFFCAWVYLCFYINTYKCETLHYSCQTQLSASFSCKMEKFSHSSFKERRSHREDFLADVLVTGQVKIMSLHPLKEGAVVGMEVVASSIQDAAQRLTAIHSHV